MPLELSKLYVQLPDVWLLYTSYVADVPACVVKAGSPVSYTAMAKLPVICVLLSSLTAPVEVPVIFASHLTP